MEDTFAEPEIHSAKIVDLIVSADIIMETGRKENSSFRKGVMPDVFIETRND
jgi:hypothetical protein